MKCTMCRFVVASTTALAGLSLTACSTAPATAIERGGETSVSLGELGPASTHSERNDVFYLGAGDELGRKIFTRYVASLRANEHYATGESDFPSPE